MDRVFRLLFLATAVHGVLCGANLAGIWMGQQAGRHGETQDIAFQFKTTGSKLAGIMFGEEFDLPVENLKFAGDQVSFTVTNINYYSGSRVTMIYRGTVTGSEIHLVRKRKASAAEDDDDAKPVEIVLKRVT